MGLDGPDDDDHMAEEEEEGPAVGPALKPRERSLAEDEADEPPTQSAKAPESEGSLLVVATTEALNLQQ